MSSIDQRVVQMGFEDKQFQSGAERTLQKLDELKKNLNFSGLKTGLTELGEATKNISLESVSKGVEDLKDRFSNLGIIGVAALMRISNQALDTGKKIISAFTIDPVKSGFQEYETQINATQTILANTQKEGATIRDVNAALDELNLYADKTIYNFTEMTKNIGTFTAAGVDLKTSVAAIKGIANLAAVSGSTSQQASTAMYQLSQALAAGTVKLMDWNSVVNAGMGGAVFQDALKETARIHGIAIDQMIKDEGSFRETLSSGWLTSEILTDTLEKFTGDLTEAQLLAKGYSTEQVKNILAMGVTASDAATKVKTFSQLVDTLKEAAQSGWSGSWRLIIGDFEEAKELYTKISDALGGAIERSNEARIKTLTEWKELGGRDSVIAAVTNLVKGLGTVVKPVGDAFHKVFQTLSGADLYGITKKFEYFTRGLYLTEQGQKNLGAAFEAVFRVVKVFTSAIGLAAVGIGKLLGFLSPVLTVVLYLAGAIGTLVNAIFGVFSSIENMMSALASAKDFFYALYNVFNSSGDVLSGILNVMFEVFDQVIRSGFDLISQVTDGLFDQYLSYIYEGFRNVAAQTYLAIKEVQNAFLTGNWDNVLAPIRAISPKIADYFGEIILSYNEGGGGLAGVVEVMFDLLVDAVRLGFDTWERFTGIEVSQYKEFWVLSIQKVRNAVTEALYDFQTRLVNFDWKGLGLQPIIDFLEKAKDSIVGIVGQLKGPISDFLDTINPLRGFSNSVSTIATDMESSFSGLASRLKQIFKGVSFGDVIKVIDTTVVAVLTGALFKFATSVRKVSRSLEKNGLPTLLKTLSDGLKDTFESVGDTLKTWQTEIKSDIIMKIAKAVAILAVALIALSFIPSEKLTSSLIAVGGLIGELTAALVALDKVVGMDDIAKLSGLSSLFIAISVSVVILSAAVAKLAKIDANKIDQGFLAVLGLVSMMTAVGYAMSQYTGDISKGSIAFILLAASVNILAKAVGKFAKMDPAGLAKGLIAVITLMGAMTTAINFMPKNSVINKKIFVDLALALTILSFCVKIIGGMPLEQAVQGVVSIGVLLAELTLASKFAKDIKFGSFIQMAAAIAIILPAVLILGAVKTEKAIQGIIAVGALLGEFVIASALAKQVNTSGFIMMALAVDLLLPAVLILGAIPWKLGLQGAIGVGLLLAEMVAATNLLPKDAATKGLGLAAMALGISVLVGALTAIAIIPFPLIIIGLIEMAAALGIMIAAAYLAAPVSGVLIALGAAFALLGVGMIGVGAGITLAAAGLATLAGLGAAAGVAIYNLGSALVSIIKNAMIGFGEGLIALAKIIKNSAPILAEGVMALIESLLQSAASKWETFKEVVGPMIDSLIDFVVAYGPKLIETGVRMFLNLITGLGSRAGEIANEGITLVLNFINGVRSRIDDLILAGIAFSVDFINGIANGLRNNMQPMLDAIWNLGDAMVQGLGQALIQGITWVVEKTKELGQAILNGIKDFFGIHSPSTVFNEIGVNLIQGLINGIGSMVSAALDMVTGLGSKIIGIFHKEDEHEDAGHENMDNLTSGYKDKETQAINMARTIQTQVIAALKSFNPKFTEAGRGNMVSFSEGLPKPLRQILETLDSIIKTSISRIEAFYGKFYDAGEYLVWGFIEGIEDNIRRAARAAAEMARRALEAAKEELDINSPSGEFRKVGGYVVFGMEDGIRDNTDKVTDATKNMANQQLQTMKDSLSDLSGLIDDELDTTPVITPVLDADQLKVDIKDLDHWIQVSAPAINGVKLEAPDDLAQSAGQILTGGYRKPAAPTYTPELSEKQPIYNFYQYNTSPKALSRLDIYRQTKNQFVRFKEVVKQGR